MNVRACRITIGMALLAAAPFAAAQQPAAAQEKIAALKESLQSSAASLRHYEWLETTTIYMSGEQKGVKENQCYYGADGKLAKVPVESGSSGSESAGRRPRGLRGAIVEGKKEDVENAVKEAAALIRQYVPPDPAKLDAAKQAGHLEVTPPDSSGNLSLKITDYLKQGDSITISLNAATDALLTLAVNSYTDEEKHAVTLDVAFGTLNDGTTYPVRITFDVKQEKLQAVVENTGYKKTGA